jgi:hypothetical protein
VRCVNPCVEPPFLPIPPSRPPSPPVCLDVGVPAGGRERGDGVSALWRARGALETSSLGLCNRKHGNAARTGRQHTRRRSHEDAAPLGGPVCGIQRRVPVHGRGGADTDDLRACACVRACVFVCVCLSARVCVRRDIRLEASRGAGRPAASMAPRATQAVGAEKRPCRVGQRACGLARLVGRPIPEEGRLYKVCRGVACGGRVGGGWGWRRRP